MIGYVYLRLFWVLARSWRAPQLDILAEVSTRLLIFPNDLDTNFHLNNGRYLTLMDIGRFDLTVRTCLLKIILNKRWYPVLAGAIIRYRKPLNAFETFDLKTRIIWWDDRWLYLEQRFEKSGVLYARSLIKVVFRHGRRSVPTAELLAAAGHIEIAAPARPQAIEHWQKADEFLKE